MVLPDWERHMNESIASKIASFFASHHERGEFVRYPREAPYKLIAPTTEPSRIVYVTKCSVLSTGLLSDLPTDVMLLSRYGLPADSDIALIGRLSDQAAVRFLGDLDPVDLLIFAWLRSQFVPDMVHFLGIRDDLLSCLSPQDRGNCTIDLDASEIEAIPLLEEALPDLYELVGPDSYRLLMAHRKIELEGLVHGHRWTPEYFWQTLFAEPH